MWGGGGHYLGLSGWALSIILTRVPLRGRQREIWLKRRGSITKEADTGVMLFLFF